MKIKCALLGVITLLLSSCNSTMSLQTDIDNYFKEKATTNYSSLKYAPMYRSVETEVGALDGVYVNVDTNRYTSLFTSKTIEGEELVKCTDSVSSFTYYYFRNNNRVIYDIFANKLEFSHSITSHSFVEYKAFIRGDGNTYRELFKIDSNEVLEDGIVLIDVLSISNSIYLYKLSTDNTYDFSYARERNDINVLSSPTSIVKESNYEYRVSLSSEGTYYYFVNKDQKDDMVYREKVVPRNIFADNVTTLFDFKFPYFDYYFAVERVYDVTNKFDFFFNEDYAKTYGISFPAGYYKIHSSHPAGYLPFRVYLSKNHNYAFALCLRISDDKLLLPEFNAVKIENNGVLAGFTNEVELMVSNKSYLKFKDEYILLNYQDVAYVSPNNCYVLKDSVGHNKIYLEPNEDYTSIEGTLVTDITRENNLLFVINDSLTKRVMSFNLSNATYTYFNVDDIYDSYNLLYRKDDRLFFQEYEVGRAYANQRIYQSSSSTRTFLNKHYKTVTYTIGDRFLNICSRSDIL